MGSNRFEFQRHRTSRVECSRPPIREGRKRLGHTGNEPDDDTVKSASSGEDDEKNVTGADGGEGVFE